MDLVCDFLGAYGVETEGRINGIDRLAKSITTGLGFAVVGLEKELPARGDWRAPRLAQGRDCVGDDLSSDPLLPTPFLQLRLRYGDR